MERGLLGPMLTRSREVAQSIQVRLSVVQESGALAKSWGAKSRPGERKMQRYSINKVGEPDLADRLALTAGDRRLESMVLLQMIRSEDPTRTAEHGRGESSPDGNLHASDADPASAYARAVSIAGFLCAEYAIETLDQKVFISELAVELAQRIAERLDGFSARTDHDPSATNPGSARRPPR
jgi:hypothetical protein